MSKFEEVCRVYQQSRQKFLEYEVECRNFARTLIDGIIDYFEWPHTQEITYIQLGEEINPNDRFYALAGAMQMDDESFWHFGVELIAEEPGGSHPMPFLMSFFIKKVGPNFIVKLGPQGKAIRIPENKTDDLGPFYEVIFQQIMQFFSKEYQDAITNQTTEPKFIMLTNNLAS
jgi:hypothetical protein